MKVVSTKIPEALYNALLKFCEKSNLKPSKAVGGAIQAMIQGEVDIKPVGRNDICPRCGHTVHLVLDDSKAYFACLNCDWAAYLGKYNLPPRSQIEDLRGKITEKDEED